MMAPVAEKKPSLKQINCFITCPLCHGYFVDATSITECLHTFCRSCIVKHFESSVFCPVCDLQVDKVRPHEKLCSDPRKQLLVYKVVPRLYQKEMAAQEKFRKDNKKKRKSMPVLPRHLPEQVKRDTIVDSVQLYGPEQRISLSLEYECGSSTSLSSNAGTHKQINSLKRYLQCPAAVTIYHLKKFIRLKYEISLKHEIVISYEGEPLQESCSLMDVAYQYFWEAKSPMRFTYDVVPRSTVKNCEPSNPQEVEITREQTPPPPPLKPTRLKSATALSASGVVESSSTTSSRDASSKRSMHRRQLRQRSAKTAAYKSLEAMDDETASEKEDSPPSKKRKYHKSPRWENDDAPFIPFTVYRSTRSGKTPKPSPIDTESRYQPRPGTKTVYSAAVSSSMADDSAWSDTEMSETRSESRSGVVSSSRSPEVIDSNSGKKKSLNEFQKTRVTSTRKKASDIYEFHSNNEDTNEDSNTTVEYDFVYDDNKGSESDNQESAHSLIHVKFSKAIDSMVHKSRADVIGDSHVDHVSVSEDNQENNQKCHAGTQRLHVNDHDLEQQIVMEVITEQDLEQHIEDSIEEVEIDADVDDQSNNEQNLSHDDLDAIDAESASTCLVIAEDDDDGVVEEVIAAEENGHELVVLENVDHSETSFTDADTTGKSRENLPSRKVSMEQNTMKFLSRSSVAPVEEDEPEILHEKVSKKKSKKTKHHHHHHHKHRHRHSPVMLVSSAEEAPIKLTLKLRPTPSISPTTSSASKSPQNEYCSKSKKLSQSKHSKEDTRETRRGASTPKNSLKPLKAYSYSLKVNSLKSSPDRAESPEIKSPTPEPLSPPAPEEFSPKSPTPEPLSPPPSLPSPSPECDSKERSQMLSKPMSSPQACPSRPSTPADTDDVNVVFDESKSRLTQLRAVRSKGSQSQGSQGESDLKRVKTPASLIISKVEAGEAPPRLLQDTKRPALEILMLPPSPPSSNAEIDETNLRGKSSLKQSTYLPTTSSMSPKTVKVVLKDCRNVDDSQSGALDLSGRAKRKDVCINNAKIVSSKTATEIPKKSSNVGTSPMADEKDFILPKNDANVAQPHDLGLVPNASLVAIRDLMSIGITSPEELTAKLMGGFTSSSQGGKHALLPTFTSLGSLSINQRGRPMPGLNDLFPNRRIGSYTIASSTPRPGPNQSVRHIPNPSALFQRQHQQQQQQHQQQLQDSIKKQQGQLTEAQLKERYQLFQQNQAARAVQTYSRLNNSAVNHKTYSSLSRVPNVVMRPSTGTTSNKQPFISSTINNSLALKGAIRSRSIEKVAGLLSVRASSFPVEAQAGR